MKLNPKEIIELLLKELNIDSISALEKQALIGNGTIGKAIKGDGLGEETIQKIINKFSNVNRDFLKTGQMPVLKQQKSINARIQELEERVIELKELNQYLKNDIIISLNEIRSNQEALIVFVKEILRRSAKYRYGEIDEERLAEELHEINIITGGVSM